MEPIYDQVLLRIVSSPGENKTETVVEVLRYFDAVPDFIPAPGFVTFDNETGTNYPVTAFSGEEVFAYLGKKKENDLRLLTFGNNTINDYSLHISSDYNNSILSIHLPELYRFDLPGFEKQFLVLCHMMKAGYGTAGLLNHNKRMYDLYYSGAPRTSKISGLKWLQYLGPDEAEKQGGAEALLQNPYAVTEQLGEGVLIRVGDTPWYCATPEGEAQLLKATAAMPPVKA